MNFTKQANAPFVAGIPMSSAVCSQRPCPCCSVVPDVLGHCHCS